MFLIEIFRKDSLKYLIFKADPKIENKKQINFSDISAFYYTLFVS